MNPGTTTADRQRLSELISPSSTDPQALAAPAPRTTVITPPPAGEPASARTLLFDSTFSHSEEIGEIVAALAKAQGAFGAIERTLTARVHSKRTGGEYTYDYAPLDVVLDAVRPALSANQIALLQFPSAGRGAVKVTTFLAHVSGQWFRNELAVGLPDGGDPQEIGKAITYARRYAVESLLGVAPEHDNDAQSVTEAMHAQRANGSAPLRPGPVPMPQRAQPATPPPQAAAPPASAGTRTAPPSGPQPSAGFTIAAIEKKPRPGKSPYWNVQFSNGTIASTFSTTMGEALERAAREPKTVYADVVITRKGSYAYIEEVIPMGKGDGW